MSGVLEVGYFLFTLIVSLLAFVLWARIALRFFCVSKLHPITQAIDELTNPIVKPVAELFSKKQSRLGRYDWPCFAVLVLLELVKFIAIGALFLRTRLPWEIVPLYIVADLIVEPCNLLFYAILIRIVMSFINPTWHHPLAHVLQMITDPLLKLGRRLLPNLAGFDISPFIILVVLKIITLFISASLPLRLI